MHDYSFKTIIAWVNTLLHNTAHVDRTRTPDIPNSSAFDLCDLDTTGLARRIYETKKLAHSNSIRVSFFFIAFPVRIVLIANKYALTLDNNNFPWKLARLTMRHRQQNVIEQMHRSSLRYIFFFIIFHVDHVQTASRYLRQNYRNF